MEKFLLALGGILFAVFVIVALSALFAWPVMLLWNGSLVGTVAGVKSVDFMTAWGISLLCGLLFKTNVTNK